MTENCCIVDVTNIAFVSNVETKLVIACRRKGAQQPSVTASHRNLRVDVTQSHATVLKPALFFYWNELFVIRKLKQLQYISVSRI